MKQFYEELHSLCDKNPLDCHFEVKSYTSGTIIQNNDANINSLIYCQKGHTRISSTLFHDEILCEGEIMFVPRMSEYSGIALSDVILLVHQFNNTICQSEKCILSYLCSCRHIQIKIYCSKLVVPYSIQVLMNGVILYIDDQMHDANLWELKHKELIWGFTHYYSVEELYSFFYPMIDEKVPLKSLVTTNYRKANCTADLADLCGYGLHNFRKIFKKEFGISPYKWLMIKRAENVKSKLAQLYIPFVDIIDEFNFSSSAHFTTFCKQYIGDTPTNLREQLSIKKELNTKEVSQSENLSQ